MKNKVVVFIIGLIAGVALGVIFDVGIKALFHQLREMHISLNKINVQEGKISQRLDSIQGKLQDNKKNKPVIVKYQSKPIVQAAPHNANTLAVTTPAKADSMPAPVDSSAGAGDNDSDVVVMTNQLVSVATLPLKNIGADSVNASTEKNDSIIAALSNVDEERDPSYFRIEFWQSPLNFKGYKMSRGKIILYGINSTSKMRLVKWGDDYYLLSDAGAYRMNYTDDYKPFEKVNDKNILKKLE